MIFHVVMVVYRGVLYNYIYIIIYNALFKIRLDVHTELPLATGVIPPPFVAKVTVNHGVLHRGLVRVGGVRSSDGYHNAW